MFEELGQVDKIYRRLSTLALVAAAVALVFMGGLVGPGVQPARAGDAPNRHRRLTALRRAILAIINNRSRPANVCPALWAPFVVTGNGGGGEVDRTSVSAA